MTSLALVERPTLSFDDEQIGRQILNRTRINTETGCLEFLGAVCSGGYGTVRIAGKTRGAHRVVYEATHGPLAEDIEVCHRCDNPRCVNIEHLFAGTRVDNQRDMYSKGRGRKAVGDQHGRAKMTSAEVIELRACREQGWSYGRLAVYFHLSKSAVFDICTGKHWKETA